MIRVGIATGEFVLSRIGAHEGGIRIFHCVGGSSTLIEVVGDEFAFAFHAALMFYVFDLVKAGECKRRGFRHLNLAVGFPGGAARILEYLADFAGVRVYFA